MHEHAVDHVGHRLAGAERADGADRQQHAEGDDQPDEHRDTDGHSDQMPHPDQRQRQARAEHGTTGPDAEERRDIVGQHLQVGQQPEAGRHQRAERNYPDADAVLLVAPRAVTDFEDLGGGHAFRIGQIRAGHQGPAQRDGVHDAEDAADRAHGHRHPVREPGPPADHDQPGQHEDDRRQRAGRRGDGLHDVVLDDGVVGEVTQDGHRDHRGRDGGGERQADLETEVDVGGGEHQRDRAAEQDAADGELAQRRGGGSDWAFRGQLGILSFAGEYTLGTGWRQCRVIGSQTEPRFTPPAAPIEVCQTRLFEK